MYTIARNNNDNNNRAACIWEYDVDFYWSAQNAIYRRRLMIVAKDGSNRRRTRIVLYGPTESRAADPAATRAQTSRNNIVVFVYRTGK